MQQFMKEKPFEISQLGKPFSINSKVGLPNYQFNKIISIHKIIGIQFPCCDIEWLKNLIGETLSEIEGLRIQYDEEKFCWNFNYGTKPIEHLIDSYELYKIIRRKKCCAFEASIKATQLFNHLYDNNDENDNENDYYIHNYWCEGSINLLYNEENDVIVIKTNKTIGDISTFYFIKKVLNDVLKNKNLHNWVKRRNYLMLVEGTPDYDYVENKITRYLFDEIICREICSFM